MDKVLILLKEATSSLPARTAKGSLLLFLNFLLFTAPAWAEGEKSPPLSSIQIEVGNSWVSLEDFVKKSSPEKASPEINAPSLATPETGGQPPAKTSGDGLELAAPQRPLNLSPLPALSPSASSQAENDDQPVAAFLDAESFAQEDRWQKLNSKSGQRSLQGKSGAVPEQTIRLSVLPSRSIVPVPAGGATPGNVSVSQKINTAKAREKEAPLACTAYEEHQKQQLKALEEDQKTIEALQAAIAELGLKKKLGLEKNASTLNDRPTTPPSSAKN